MNNSSLNINSKLKLLKKLKEIKLMAIYHINNIMIDDRYGEDDYSTVCDLNKLLEHTKELIKNYQAEIDQYISNNISNSQSIIKQIIQNQTKHILMIYKIIHCNKNSYCINTILILKFTAGFNKEIDLYNKKYEMIENKSQIEDDYKIINNLINISYAYNMRQDLKLIISDFNFDKTKKKSITYIINNIFFNSRKMHNIEYKRYLNCTKSNGFSANIQRYIIEKEIK